MPTLTDIEYLESLQDHDLLKGYIEKEKITNLITVISSAAERYEKASQEEKDCMDCGEEDTFYNVCKHFVGGSNLFPASDESVEHDETMEPSSNDE